LTDASFRQSDELRRFWDEIARGKPANPGALDPDITATIRRLYALRDVPPPDLMFANRLEESLMHAAANRLPLANPRHPLDLNGLSAPILSLEPLLSEPFPARRWAPANLVTALFVLIALIGALFVFGPGRRGQQEVSPVFLPAISGTPATPESMTKLVVEFEWMLYKVPERHFIELGRPTVDPEGNLWVPDAAFDQYHIIAPDGTFIESWGASGSGEGQFDFSCEDLPYGSIAFDDTGTFYVLDSGNHRIQKFSPDRTFITSWGSEGSADDQFTCPAVIVVDQQGRVFVSDRGANKIVVFDGDGNWIDTWPTPPAASGLAVDQDGNLWVVSYEAGTLTEFSPEGEPVVTWDRSPSGEWLFNGPSYVAIDELGRIFVSEHDGNRIQIFAPDGTLLGAWGELGAKPGQFNEPRGIALDREGGVYVTEWAGNRVQKFRLVPPLGPPTGTPQSNS
jgi:hypothetical protein